MSDSATLVRDSKNLSGPALSVPASDWVSFLAHLTR
ncbi:MAG: DUF397 domain-containing protein [Kibdelosporangium sp.]